MKIGNNCVALRGWAHKSALAAVYGFTHSIPLSPPCNNFLPFIFPFTFIFYNTLNNKKNYGSITLRNAVFLSGSSSHHCQHYFFLFEIIKICWCYLEIHFFYKFLKWILFIYPKMIIRNWNSEFRFQKNES